MAEKDLVTAHRAGCAVVITLNLPARRNLLTGPSVNAMVSSVEAAESDPEVRALIFTGAGTAFCAGADLAILERAAEGDFDNVRRIYDSFLRVMRSPLLTIAAVNGPAMGAGLNLVLACDLRLAGRSAVFDTRFSALHVHPGGGNAWLMNAAVGGQEALLGVLLGEWWNAEEARARGLVARVVDDESLLAVACELAERVAHHDREYVCRVISALRAARSGADHGQVLEMETDSQEWSLRQEKAAASLAAARRRISGSAG